MVFKDFSERDRRILNFIRPHAALAYKNAERFTEITRQVNLRDAALESLDAGLIELDYKFNIIRLTDLASDCLCTFFPEWNRESIQLPEKIHHWLDRHIMVQNKVDEHALNPPYLLIEKCYGRLILRLLPSEDDNHLVVSIERCTHMTSSDSLRNFGLTNREADVLFWVAQEKSNLEISTILSISPATVKKHLESIFNKLEIDSRTQAAIKAINILQANHLQ